MGQYYVNSVFIIRIAGFLFCWFNNSDYTYINTKKKKKKTPVSFYSQEIPYISNN